MREPGRFLTVLLAALLAGSSLQAKELALLVHPGPSQLALPCKESALRLTTLGSREGAQSAPLRFKARMGVPAKVEVPEGPWELELEAEGCWAPARRILVTSSDPDTIHLPVWPQTQVLGRLGVPRGAVPDRLLMEFSTSFADPTAEEPVGKVLCPLREEGSFRCPVPAAKLDLRLSAPGYAPNYWWEVETKSGAPFNLATVRLVPGASLAGWLLTPEGSPPEPESVEVTLVPAGLADAESLGDQLQRRFSRAKAEVLDNGFFSVQSLRAGEYLLTVTGEAFAETRTRVSLVERRESVLRDPVVLAPPLSVGFVIDPPTDPQGQPWLLTLARLHESGTYADTVVQAEVPLDGWYEAKSLNPGLHHLTVAASNGDVVTARHVRIGEEPEPIAIDIEAVRVDGTVTLGDEALAAKIWYGGRFGAQKVQVESDGEGAYSASLPRAGTWEVEVESKVPRVQKRWPAVEVPQPDAGEAAQVDLALPGTRVFGVVRERGGGRPRTKTIVYAYSGTARASAASPVDEDGRFEFYGLDEGPLRLHAWSAGSRSRTVLALLSEDEEREINLTLEPTFELQGVVVGESGPVPGANVQLQPAQEPFLPIPRERADGSGRFSVAMPAGTRTVLATVSLPGRTLGVFQVPVTEDDEVAIRLPSLGGTLVLEIPAGEDLTSRTSLPLFFRDGLPFAVHEVLHWASLHPQEDPRPDRRIIPGLLEGHYEICTVPAGDYVPWMMGYRDQDRCTSGFLPALGELELTLPGSRDE